MRSLLLHSENEINSKTFYLLYNRVFNTRLSSCLAPVLVGASDKNFPYSFVDSSGLVDSVVFLVVSLLTMLAAVSCSM